MKHIPVFLSSDNSYAPFVATTMASVCANTASFVDFYVLDGGIDAANKEKIARQKFANFSLEFIRINTDEVFRNFRNIGHFSISAYSRFLIPQLKPQIDRAVYSDIDIIALGDITEMYEQGLDSFALGAVFTEGQAPLLKNKNLPILRKNMHISENHSFFCSAELLLDCRKWRADRITEKLFAIERQYRQVLLTADQDILNKYFDSNYKMLEDRFCIGNRSTFWCKKYDVDRSAYLRNKPVIRHFAGPLKPWHLDKITFDGQIIDYDNFNDFWHYAEMTAFYAELRRDYDLNYDKRLQALQTTITSKNTVEKMAPATVAPITTRSIDPQFFTACNIRPDIIDLLKRGVKFPHPVGIVINEYAKIGDGTIIRQNVTVGSRGSPLFRKKMFPPDGHPTIGKKVDICAGAVVLGNITVGDNAIIGANAVVTHDVPENAIVAGAPARVIGWNIPNAADKTLVVKTVSTPASVETPPPFLRVPRTGDAPFDEKINRVFARLQDDESRYLFVKRLDFWYDGHQLHLDNLIKMALISRFKENRRAELLRDAAPIILCFPPPSAPENIDAALRLLPCWEKMFGIKIAGIWHEKCGGGQPSVPHISTAELLRDYRGATLVFMANDAASALPAFDYLSQNGFKPEQFFAFLGTPSPFVDYGFLGKAYFDLPELTPAPEEIFIAAGACASGAAILDFVAFTGGNYRKIYAIEPDAARAQNLRQNLADLGIERVELIDRALWNESVSAAPETDALEKLQTDGAAKNAAITRGLARVASIRQGLSPSADADDAKIPPNSIDALINAAPSAERITRIKIDVGTAGADALAGAAATLRRDKPQLAIALSHHTDDVVNLSAAVLDLVPEYRLFIRHYSYTAANTVLYAVI
jgi:FkbM family methyltransferase